MASRASNGTKSSVYRPSIGAPGRAPAWGHPGRERKIAALKDGVMPGLDGGKGGIETLRTQVLENMFRLQCRRRRAAPLSQNNGKGLART